MKTALVIGALTITAFTLLAESPPVAIPLVLNAIEAPPIVASYTLSGGSLKADVLAPNGLTAQVVLDASLSYDPDNDDLQYFWFTRDVGEHSQYIYSLFAEGIRTTNTFGVGSFGHGYAVLRLGVFDGTEWGYQTVYLNVESPTFLLKGMRDEVEDEGTPSPAYRLLLGHLDRAIEHFENGQTRQGLHFVELFARRLLHNSAGIDPARTHALLKLSVLLLESVSYDHPDRQDRPPRHTTAQPERFSERAPRQSVPSAGRLRARIVRSTVSPGARR